MSDTASLDAQVLLAHVLERPRAWLLAHPEAVITLEQAHALEAALARLEAGEPLPYLLGCWEFYGLDFVVTPAALIPRPETELLVEQALSWLAASPGQHRALDVGTGTGCIAVALAANVPELQVVASDRSLEALRVARTNAQRHNLSAKLRFVQADLLPPLSVRFDLICANLPYIPREMLAGLRVSRWEPRLALDGGQDGMALISRLLDAAPEALADGGLLLLEIEAFQGAAVRDLAGRAFPAAEVSILHDLANKERLLCLRI